MPTVRPISDLQRNFGAIASECHETKRPVYLTKNGSASLVVMDADAFDSLREYEERVQRAIARGYDDMLNGRTRAWAQAKADADRIRQARHGA